MLNAKHRLYMTATPRIYGDTLEKRQEAKKTLKDKSGKDLLLFDMGDEELFGSEIFSLKFGEAIKRNILSDYRVIISFMSEELITQYLGALTKAQEHSKLSIHDAGQMIGFAHALTKKNIVLIDTDGSQQTPDEELKQDVFGDTTLPMRRALCFHSSIRHSKFVTDNFKVISQDITLCHIDGTDNAAEKAKKLFWLSEEEEEGKCRVLSNAKCLTEGIDVPSLDAIAFFDPRDSVVDIVQAVGRAIRKSEGKKYGYIILPIVLSDKEIQEYDKTLKSDKFKGIWKVLKALRSHDERLVDIGRINEVVKITADAKESQSLPEATLFALQELFDNMKNAIPKHLGDLAYWELYGAKVGGIMHSLALRIKDLIENHNDIKALFESFCKALQGNLNASFDTDEATALIAQHIIIKPIFKCIFPNLDFSTFDKVSHELDKLYQELCTLGLESEIKDLQRFYESVKQNAQYAQSDRSKQDLIRNLYDRLFKEAFKKTQEKLGIVYTPIEVVDFIIHSIAYALKKHFNKNLSDENVHICDPFTGTGTFFTRLIQSGYLDANLESKYKNELWANEITLLGYYIAQINITTAYHERLSKPKETSALSPHSPDCAGFEGDIADHLSSSPLKPTQNQQSRRANLGSLESEVDSQTQDSSLTSHNPKNSSITLECEDSKLHNQTDSYKDSQAEGFSDNFVDSKESKNQGRSILEEKSGLCSLEQGGRIDAFTDEAKGKSPRFLPKSQAQSESFTLFDNLLFTDTFNTYTPDSKGFQGKKEYPQLFQGEYLKKNYDKIQEFKNTDFKILVGNPPYSANQDNENDNNANTNYPSLESRIAETYVKNSTSTNKNKVYDTFKLAMRYASDRIGESGGIIGFVTNGSFIEGNADSGLRACLESEFDYIYIFNLRGNQRTSGETSRKEGGKIFDSGSRTPVAISILIKCEDSQNTDSLKSSKTSHNLESQIDSFSIRGRGLNCEVAPSPLKIPRPDDAFKGGTSCDLNLSQGGYTSQLEKMQKTQILAHFVVRSIGKKEAVVLPPMRS
uniref:site-specific DNA-methyltransferase (adenine-specific) n=1 Tax=uncultured Helicobacter sp. TaxID=175537 RepID=A0A650EKE4_9HELI|nr:hypothetical protein Helico4rc_2230 [uncultured Helicobacter sp.]